MNFYRIPIARFLFPYVLGLVFANYFGEFSYYSAPIVMLFCLISFWIKKQIHIPVILALGFSFLFGVWVFHIHKEILRSDPLPVEQKVHGVLSVEEILKQTTEKVSFISNVKGNRIVVYLKDTTQFTLPGDNIWVKNVKIAPLDTGGFFKNYTNFLIQRGVKGVLFLHSKNISKRESSSGIEARIYAFRCKLCKIIIQHHVFEPAELGIFLSLIIGERSYLPHEVKDDYKLSGLIHILAISGLHIGVLYVFVLLIFKLFHIYHLPTQFIGVFFTLVIYALIAGLSASVVRAVLMCLLLQFGSLLRLKTPILNIVLSSALFLLVFQPNWLWDIGFQLSYAAVIVMVILLPFFQKMGSNLKGLWTKKILDLFWVNVTATLGTYPLLLYHFKVVFIGSVLSGMVIVPLSSLAVIVGVISLAFYKFDGIFHFLLNINQYLLFGMNKAVEITNAGFCPKIVGQYSFLDVILFYVFIFFMFYRFKRFNMKLVAMSITLLLWFIVQLL